jgi:hypothetical protein
MQNNGRRKSLSILLEEYAASLGQDQVSIGDIADLLGSRSLGGLLLVFALPVALPIPMPGISAVFGIILVLLSVQLALGLQHVWLPGILHRQCIPADRFKRIVGAVVPVLRRMEKAVWPRWTFLHQKWIKIPVGLICILLSLVVMLPIPFGNVVPSFAIALFALALIQQDGVALAIGFLTTVFALALTVMASIGLEQFVDHISFL